MLAIDLFDQLPGENLMRQGLDDFMAGRCTIASCLVAIARPRLEEARLLSIDTPEFIRTPELQLFRLLQEEEKNGDPYGRYNSLLRELVSFEQALDHRLSRANRANRL